MAYLISIVRTEHGKPARITRAEIERFVATSPQFRLVSSAADGVDLVCSPQGRETLRLALQNGELVTNSPTDDQIQVMLDIANNLNARVRDESLETYRAPNDTYVHPDDLPQLRIARAEDARVARRSDLGKILYFVILAGICILIGYLLTRP
jgi:hypothetical protein